MPRGGRRAGAGRKPGSVTKRTREIAEGAVAAGLSPLEYMLAVVHDPKATQERRDTMAVAAAPYIHPRLGSVSAAVDATYSVSHKIVPFEVQPIPTDHFLTPEAIVQLSLTGPALVIDNAEEKDAAVIVDGEPRSMTRKECEAMVRRVYADPNADPEETKLVVDVVFEELLLSDYDGAVALMHRLWDELEAPTRH